MNYQVLRLNHQIRRFFRYTAVASLCQRCELTHRFLGPNGAGKSTPIRILMGLDYASSGTAQVLGRDQLRDTVGVRRCTGYLPGELSVYPRVTGREILDRFGSAAKLVSVLAGMLAGADMIDGLDVLRHGAMGKLFTGMRAPSTLGTFLRSFRFGHVRQVDPLASRTLALRRGRHCGYRPRRSLDAGRWPPDMLVVVVTIPPKNPVMATGGPGGRDCDETNQAPMRSLPARSAPVNSRSVSDRSTARTDPTLQQSRQS